MYTKGRILDDALNTAKNWLVRGYRVTIHTDADGMYVVTRSENKN